MLKLFRQWRFTAPRTTPNGYRQPWSLACYRMELEGKWGFELKIIRSEEHGWGVIAHLGFPRWQVSIPKTWLAPGRQRDSMIDMWGVGIHEDYLHWNWEAATYNWQLPWGYERHSCLYLTSGHTWSFWEARQGVFTFPYTYRCQDGIAHHRQISVTVQRCQWRQRWLQWWPWHTKTRQWIDFTFNQPVCGVYGSSYEMEFDESVEACVRRMERHRQFD